jgi:hypothetical protein
MDFKRLLIGAALTVCGSAHASVFVPADGNINFVFDTFNAGTTLAMFDDSDSLFTGNNLLISPLPQNIAVASGGLNAGDWTATNESFATLNLTGSNMFRLAISTDGGTSWSGDISTSPAGTNILNVTFIDGTVLSVDINVAPVPVPAAVWLFGSGLLGMVGVARRKKAA